MPLSPAFRRNYVCGLKPTQPKPAEQPQPGFRRPAGAETQEEDQHRDECPFRLREEFPSGELRPLATRKGVRRKDPAHEPSLPVEPEAYLRGDPADRRTAAHGKGSDSRLVLQPAPEGETHQPLQRGPHAAQSGEADQLQPSPGTGSREWGDRGREGAHKHVAICMKTRDLETCRDRFPGEYVTYTAVTKGQFPGKHATQPEWRSEESGLSPCTM